MNNENKVTSKYNGANTTTRKAGLIADNIRKHSVNDALIYLQFSKNKASRFFEKAIKSGVANAQQKSMNVTNLEIDSILVGPGMTLPGRGMIGARGRFKPMKKRSTNITVILREKAVESKKEDK